MEKKDPGLEGQLTAWARHRDLDLLITMTAYTDPDFKRELAVYAPDKQMHDNLVHLLKTRGLALSPMSPDTAHPAPQGTLSFHTQGNTGISRKNWPPSWPPIIPAIFPARESWADIRICFF